MHALNNQAVLSIRQGNLNGESQISSPLQIWYRSNTFAVYHNANLIMDSGADLGGQLSLAKIIAAKPEGNEIADNYLMHSRP